jgi:hypothetical protein
MIYPVYNVIDGMWQIQQSYRDINRFLNWELDEDGFYRATSHMLRKFFNTQLINAGMAEEIREHMMGHKV